jgi:hypothetical protein
VRARQKVIGTFRCDRGPTGALLDLLDDDELTALDRWLSARRDRQEQARHRHTFDATHSRLTELVATIHASAELLSPAEAAAIWRDLADVARALTRAGYARPRRTRKPPAPLPGQGDLLNTLN